MTLPASRRTDSLRDGWVAVAVGAILLVHAALGWDAARRLTVTHDEYWHLPVGLLNIRTGRFEFDTLNPPLTRLWAALPLVVMGAKSGPADAQLDPEQHGEAFLSANLARYGELLAAGRAANLVWSMLGGAVLALWAREVFGRVSAIAAAIVWACCPTILAHASLVTPDAGLTCWFLASLYAVWRFAHSASWAWAVLLGVCVGFALATKFTAVLLVPLAPLLWFVARFRNSSLAGTPVEHAARVLACPTGGIRGIDRHTRAACATFMWFVARFRNPSLSGTPVEHAARVLPLPTTGIRGIDRHTRAACATFMWLVSGLIALTLLNGAYLFQGTFSRLDSYRFASRTLKPLEAAPGWIGALPVPLPRHYVKGLDRQRHIMESEHPVFLDGQWNVQPGRGGARGFPLPLPFGLPWQWNVQPGHGGARGFPHYYLMALLYKLPHGFQLLLLMAAWTFLRSADARPWRLLVFVAIPGVVLLVISSASGMQLGVRYVLPVFPLLMLVGVFAVSRIDFARARWRSVLVVAALLAAPLSLRHHPAHLAYFNELAGGPVGGRQHLLDSNLDWGQNLLDVKRFIEERKLRTIGLAYFGTAPPRSFGIDYTLPPREPQPGWYAVSVNFVMGRPYNLRRPDGRKQFTGGEYVYFQDFTPQAALGGSIDVYFLSERDVLRWHSLRRERGE